ncbi:MAG: hypothetical protein JSS65_04960 [Armatimonadetes bacterium]|nr:hypothetical protein [Armatimonadota bacterium]
MSRRNLARELYPASTDANALNALRQCLHRMKQWLGPEALQADNQFVGLTTGVWEVKRPPTRHTSFPPTPTPGQAAAKAFQKLVTEVAQLDTEEARLILLGSKTVADSLPLSDWHDLLALTAPRSMKEAHAYDHMASCARYCHRTLMFQRAVTLHTRVFRQAMQANRPNLVSRSSSWLLFSFVEMGDMEAARKWLPTVIGSDRTNAGLLFAANARACCAWNALDLTSASEQFDRASRLIHTASRTDQAHYWSNFAVFCAEAGHVSESRDNIARAKALLVPGLDVVSDINCRLADAICARQAGSPAVAVDSLRGCHESESRRGDMLSALYCDEYLAEALACIGEKADAVRLWRNSEQRRLAGGGRLTPRLQAMKSRIEAMIA